MKVIGMIADHPTPKIQIGGGTAYTMNSRIRLVSDNTCQTLNERMGTGGGNVPLILEIHDDLEVTDGSCSAGINAWTRNNQDGWNLHNTGFCNG